MVLLLIIIMVLLVGFCDNNAHPSSLALFCLGLSNSFSYLSVCKKLIFLVPFYFTLFHTSLGFNVRDLDLVCFISKMGNIFHTIVSISYIFSTIIKWSPKEKNMSRHSEGNGLADFMYNRDWNFCMSSSCG